MTLEAISGGMVVANDSIVLASDPSGAFWVHHTLSVSGVEFESIRLVGSGPENQGAFFGQIDNVRMVPAPGATSAAALAGLIALRRRRS